MKGLEKFKEYFQGYENYYVIIGGTACVLLNEEAGLDFRATRDIDMVLIVENMDENFVKHFWQFVQMGEYQNVYRGEHHKNFYRFQKPLHEGFPIMIELFSRRPTHYSLYPKSHLLPLHIADDISSLSAILLDDDYYYFLKNGIRIVSGMPVLDEEHLIPFKAKAWCELTDRKLSGESGLTKHIKKHLKDIITLSRLIAVNHEVKLEGKVAKDMERFIKDVQIMNSDNQLIKDICNNLSIHYLIEKVNI